MFLEKKKLLIKKSRFSTDLVVWKSKSMINRKCRVLIDLIISKLNNYVLKSLILSNSVSSNREKISSFGTIVFVKMRKKIVGKCEVLTDVAASK